MEEKYRIVVQEDFASNGVEYKKGDTVSARFATGTGKADPYLQEKVKTPDGERWLYKIDGGGWIQNYSCLSLTGKSWIEEEAIVCNGSVVFGDAVVKSGYVSGSTIGGEAVVEGNSKIVNSKVFGKVDSSEIHSSSVMDGGEVVGRSKVAMGSVIYGMVADAKVADCVIYGFVGEKGCAVRSTVMPDGGIKGKIVVYRSRVDGIVEEING